ncbi:hypothetical protein [Phenylobacterium sp.]|uniref:hypothetical protein n=1 Tax=Phenylobacterium sp. TaxID=1871053 RepID=UPI00272F4393|nr:hypothetical protein [Phenylobacterium sp.]MDP1617486.1 hypothetical protein [Phenylobacterium sp.]MDP1986776.1 hypothetical protein [Phenylobacterium sp.]
MICRAAGGVSASVGAHAPAPLASDCIGDIIRAGGPGGVSAYTGGRPGGDLDDADSLRLGGVSRRGADLARPVALGNQPVFADYGSGGVAGLNTAGSNAWWPQPASGGNDAHGGASVIVLEFYDRRPR